MTLSEPPVAALKAELFKALGHPVRIRALEQLVDGERTVGELAEAIGVELAPLSQQLAVLRRAGVVTSRREGSSVVYRLRDPQIAELLALTRRMLVTSLQEGQLLLSSIAEPAATTAP